MVEVRFHKLEGQGGVFPRIRFSMEVIIPSSEQQYKGYLINAFGEVYVYKESPPVYVGNLWLAPQNVGSKLSDHYIVTFDLPVNLERLRYIEEIRKEEDFFFDIRQLNWIIFSVEDKSLHSVWWKPKHGDYSEGLIHVEESLWLKILKDIGYNEIRIAEIPIHIFNRLDDIRKELGMGTIWEVISELIKSYKKEASSYLLLTKNEEIREKIESMLKSANKEILIMSKVIDVEGVDLLTEAKKRGVDVKVVVGVGEGEKEAKQKRLSEAYRRLREANINFKVNSNAHARIVVADEFVLIGSTDLDIHGLRIHLNASIYSNDVTMVEKAKQFIIEIFEK